MPRDRSCRLNRGESAGWFLAVLLTALGANSAAAYVPDDAMVGHRLGGDRHTGHADYANVEPDPGQHVDSWRGREQFDRLFRRPVQRGTTSGNLTQRPWFHLFQESFDSLERIGRHHVHV